MTIKPRKKPAQPVPLNNHALIERKLGPIEYRSIDSLKYYANNPRKHPERQIVKLQDSVNKFGLARPILVDKHNVIISGEAVTEAARRLGFAQVPVIVATGWSKAQVQAYRLADNRLAELGEWDETILAIEIDEIIAIDEFSIDLLGWETAEIDILLENVQSDAGAHTSDPADAPIAPPATPVSRPDDLWHMDRHRLLCGSSLDQANWERLMGEDVAAMAFADAPYNVRIDGHVSGLGKVRHEEFAMASGEMSSEQFTTFLTESVGAMAAAMRDGGLLYLCMDWRHIGEMLRAIAACGLSLLNLCVWNKANAGMGSLYRSKHELVFVAKKGKASHTNNVQLGRHGRYRTNVWDYAGANSFGATRIDDLADHPTVKPVALVADSIRDATCPGDIVIDGFMGSGTTILAAERTRRIGCGIEIAPAYVDVAIRRWEAMTGKAALLAATGQSFAEVAAERAHALADAA